MKKTLRILSLALLLVMALGILVSCANKLSGTYESEAVFGLSTTYTFDGENFTKKELGIESRGTYTIEDGNITFNFDSALADTLGWEASKTCTFEKDGDIIRIDGKIYTKQD